MSNAQEKKTVAIVVPFFKKELSPDERVSLKHLMHFLGRHDKYLVVPEGLRPDFCEGFAIKEFNKACFSTHNAHTFFRLSKKFYQAFSDYEFVLIYELDSLVFSDMLIEWCKKGYDYIGAPWFKAEAEKIGWKLDKDYVGNSGFSLRKVKTCLKVLQIYNARHNYLNFFKLCVSKFPKKLLELVARKQSLQRILSDIKVQKNIVSNPEIAGKNEDFFWSFDAADYYPAFKVPSPEIAVSFSFEVGPKYCFGKNNNELPFGCHAFAKYDRQFWEKYLLK